MGRFSMTIWSQNLKNPSQKKSRIFFWKNQDELLTPFINPFFENLADIYKNKDMHYSSAFGNVLFPSIFNPKMILNKTESFLEVNEDLPKLCKKGLIENCDHLKRRIPILDGQK